ncbi:DNA helicase HerA-like ATPase [Constrictibacter sp. MBR-5]|uniref:ATP-binding protein n=1 Tax=Constrictibacter sp. MBR-5 TaxID=3156467 RepID=UPI003398AB85
MPDDATLVLPRSGTSIKIGRVVSVSGAQIIALIRDPRSNGEHPAEQTVQVGSLVKIYTADTIVFGMVSGFSIPIPTQEPGDTELKIAEVDLVGEESTEGGDFQRGVSQFPALGADVYSATQEDLGNVYARPAVATVRVGTIHQDKTIPAFVVLDDLLGKHFAILGTTGSGKSCAVALILHALLDKHDNAHVVLLDPHGEYASAFGEAAEVLDSTNLQLPYWLFNFEELAEIIFGSARADWEGEAAILRETITQAKLRLIPDPEDANFVTVDTPVPYKISEVTRAIDEAMGKLERRTDVQPYMRLKSRLMVLQSDRRFTFMFPQGVVLRDNMVSVLSRIFRLPANGKPIAIIDLSGIPSEVINVVVSVIARMTLDIALWSERQMPILLVCEEAHRYAPQNSDLGFEPAKRALSRIAKEGRKYGLSLCVITQRPSELEAGLLSQCNTIFALRMTSQKDQEFVNAAISDATPGLMGSLPSLRNAEAIVVGEGVTVPMRLHFDELPEDRRPRSGNAHFSALWQTDDSDTTLLANVVDRWRRQRR